MPTQAPSWNSQCFDLQEHRGNLNRLPNGPDNNGRENKTERGLQLDMCAWPLLGTMVVSHKVTTYYSTIRQFAVTESCSIVHSSMRKRFHSRTT